MLTVIRVLVGFCGKSSRLAGVYARPELSAPCCRNSSSSNRQVFTTASFSSHWSIEQSILIGGSCRVTLVVTFGFLLANFRNWWGLRNGTLSFCDCRRRWQRHTDPTCCNQIHLNFLHSQAVGMLKHLPRTRSCPRTYPHHLVKHCETQLSIHSIQDRVEAKRTTLRLPESDHYFDYQLLH